MNRYIPIYIIGILVLAGCTQGREEGGLREFFKADAQRALALAERTNDERAVRCFTYLISRVPEKSVTPSEKDGKFGILTAYQVARTARRSVAGIRSAEYFEACGPMEMESRAAIRRGIFRAVSPF